MPRVGSVPERRCPCRVAAGGPGRACLGHRRAVRTRQGSDRGSGSATSWFTSQQRALGSFLQEWGQATGVADKAFGSALLLLRVSESVSAD